MKVLVACEESQAVCKAFRDKGHRAFFTVVLTEKLSVGIARIVQRCEAKRLKVLRRQWLNNGGNR